VRPATLFASPNKCEFLRLDSSRKDAPFGSDKYPPYLSEPGFPSAHRGARRPTRGCPFFRAGL